jgi:hypothetical protein
LGVLQIVDCRLKNLQSEFFNLKSEMGNGEIGRWGEEGSRNQESGVRSLAGV